MGRQEWTANRTERFAPSDIIFDFQNMYISRRGDTVGPPVWKSTILHIFLKSKLSVLEAMAVRVPMMYIAPSTPSHTNSYRVSDCAISHLVSNVEHDMATHSNKCNLLRTTLFPPNHS